MVKEDNEIIVNRDGLTLFDRFGKMIYAYIRRYITSREEAKDLALDVFVAALDYHNLDLLPEKEQGMWLRRVAHNKIVDRHRRAVRHPLIALDDIVEELLEDEDESPEQVALQREMYQQVHQVVKQLPLLQQQILQWRYGDELCFAEIAILLNKREEAVRQMCSRTVARLRNLFHEHGGENNDRE